MWRPRLLCAFSVGAEAVASGSLSLLDILAGRGASLMTGSAVVVDGGYTCW
jgi:hypothetical protein